MKTKAQAAQPCSTYAGVMTAEAVHAVVNDRSKMRLHNRIYSSWRYALGPDQTDTAWNVWTGVINTTEPLTVQWLAGKGVEDLLDTNGVLPFPPEEEVEFNKITVEPPPQLSHQEVGRRSLTPATPSRNNSPLQTFEPPSNMNGRLELTRFQLGHQHLSDRETTKRLHDRLDAVDTKLELILSWVQSGRGSPVDSGPASVVSAASASTVAPSTPITIASAAPAAVIASPAAASPTVPVPRTVAKEAAPNATAFDCNGCAHFACLAEVTKNKKKLIATKQALASHGDKGVTRWLNNHGFLIPKPTKCEHLKKSAPPACTSTQFYLKSHVASIHWVCSARGCGKEFRAFAPRENPFAILQFVIEYVGMNQRLAEPAINMFSPEAARKVVHLLGEAAMVFNAETIMLLSSEDGMLWKYMEWDETFHGQRKYQKGHRTRKAGTLTFVGGVTKSGNTVLDGVIAGVPSKARAQQVPLLLELTAPNAVVVTDGAKMYTGLNEAGVQHKWVNHKKEFVNAEGDTTNAVEGFWSVLKRTLREFWAHNASDATEVAQRYQLACYLANARQSGYDNVSAAALLWRCCMQYQANPLYPALVTASRATFAVPNQPTLEAWIEEQAAAEAASETAEEAANFDDGVDLSPLALNQEGSRDKLEPTARKLHMTEERGAATAALANAAADEEQDLFASTLQVQSASLLDKGDVLTDATLA